jgi:large subunit ribosomal protein L13
MDGRTPEMKETMKTFTPKAGEIEEQWFLVDAKDEVLGRLASRIALVLRGKNDPRYTPHANMHNHVVVVNADKIRLTGKKWTEKTYYHHSGWIGGIKSVTAEKLMEKKPTEMVRKAVRGMIPHNRLGEATMKRLRLYIGPEHDQQAQNPVPIDLVKKRKEK